MLRKIGWLAAAVLAGGGTVIGTPAARADDAATTTVRFTDVGEHPFTVPDGIFMLHVVAVGAPGGQGFAAPGGVGARATADLAVTPGQQLYVEVGGPGVAALAGMTYVGWPEGGYNYGGRGGMNGYTKVPPDVMPPASLLIGFPGSGGGGASDVQTCSNPSPPLLTGVLPDMSTVCVAPGPWRASLLTAGGGGGAGLDSAGGRGGTPVGESAAVTAHVRYPAMGGDTNPAVDENAPWDAWGADGDFYGGGGGGGGYNVGRGGWSSYVDHVAAASGGGGGSSYGPPGTVFAHAADGEAPSVTISYSFAVHLVPRKSPALTVRVAGSSTVEGARIVAAAPVGDAGEAWLFQPVGGYYQIVDAGSGMCLTSDQNPGHPLYQWWCSGTGGQLWQLGPGFNGVAPALLRNAASGLYLDVDGTGTVVARAFTGASSQYFSAPPV